MTLAAYLPVLIQILLAVAFAIIILGASYVFGQRALHNKFKDSAYECGIPNPSQAHPKFAIKFYVIAMLFILFDIEVVFIIPWVMVYREFLAASIPILLPMLFFFLLLLAGFVYEMKKNALKWES
ncbi:MAG: NADH-quinone oxidoreductase subunit I [Verrucomicrobia bacterium CG_4_10_14_3_um_filter_43_23]|nr:MAG: NADH-quinone oxidoreductase subunit I [Verrucomicrobia bacterium CG1_02_43_26]PIX58101.1 MAG: NADH-quinone oxidoreductase subunit I [Verrucomicrobia bacterium CG_4_10_14_3_um_filter_43_23]